MGGRERVDDAWRAALSRLVRALELDPFDRKDGAEAEQSVRRDRVVALHAPVEASFATFADGLPASLDALSAEG